MTKAEYETAYLDGLISLSEYTEWVTNLMYGHGNWQATKDHYDHRAALMSGDE